MIFEEDKIEIKEMINQAMTNAVKQGIEESRKPVESDADRKERIMNIKNPIERQKAIRENMDLFRG